MDPSVRTDHPQHGDRRNEVARDAGDDRDRRVAEMVERLIAADTPAEDRATENAEADDGDARRKDGVGQAGRRLRDRHRPEQGHKRRNRDRNRNDKRARALCIVASTKPPAGPRADTAAIPPTVRTTPIREDPGVPALMR